ncbi:putative Sphinganine C4-hydroxylase [Calocera cornea HHB12733]|uniref:Putative Sphinganine C4-hydroxylase n=1 Tax=Calocera cornea HHB12733 TaxID=1353952 RepID=A0A165FJQ9_9BASI|nr:putative Sphinganine C4-hydroxylase [Calocera cornea HHB12733]
MSNSSVYESFPPYNLVPDPVTFPFYYAPRPSVIPGLSDAHLALLAPIIVYWCYSLIFHLFDTWPEQFPWLDKYRIHDSAEIKSRNLVTKAQVVRAVILQQAIQTALGLWWVEEDRGKTNHAAAMRDLAPWVVSISNIVLGPRTSLTVLQRYGTPIVEFVYWWAIPAIQLLFATFFIDTWQYFWHRAFHVNKYLYRQFHSHHHRLYVPYAFGALYNHPLEGLILDTVGTAIAEAASFMTVRQACFLFMLATFKTVDDHCGYAIWWDPFQLLFGNNADYHDIHHQQAGIKRNFSQPFFTHWDAILNTRLTRRDFESGKVKGVQAIHFFAQGPS